MRLVIIVVGLAVLLGYFTILWLTTKPHRNKD